MLRIIESAPAFWSLALLSALAGLGMLWVFRACSDQAAIRALKRRRSAFLLEMRLYGDDPGLIFRAQRALLSANLRYLGYMLVPFLVMLVPMVLLLVQLDALYGKRPLEIGKSALVTVQFDSNRNVAGEPPRLEAPDGLAVESPPVRAVADRQVVWRVRPARSVDGTLRVSVDGRGIEKHVAAGEAPRYLMSRRWREWTDYFREPGEARLPAGPVEWIEVAYPAAEIKGLGVEMHWVIWFLLISMAAALMFRGRMKVTF